MMKQLLFTLILITTITSCSTGRITTTTTKSDEAIVFGRIKIISDKCSENKSIRLHFNNRTSGKHSVLLDDKAFFYTKVPIGTNFLASIVNGHPSYYKYFPNNYISINIPSSDHIYYIGDIEINLTENEWDLHNGGALGVILAAKQPGHKVPIKVTSSDNSINHFKELFPQNEKDIITQLSIINK